MLRRGVAATRWPASEFGFNPLQDRVVIIPTYTASQMAAAFRDNTDIASATYVGHGGKGVLYLGGNEGADFNLSVSGGPVNGVSDSSSILVLPGQNVLIGANIGLYSCYSSVSDPGGTSIGQAFANQFDATVTAAGAGFRTFHANQ